MKAKIKSLIYLSCFVLSAIVYNNMEMDVEKSPTSANGTNADIELNTEIYAQTYGQVYTK